MNGNNGEDNMSKKKNQLDYEKTQMIGREMEKGIEFGGEILICMIVGAIFATIKALIWR